MPLTAAPFFVAGDQEADRAGKTGAALAEEALGRGDKGGDRPFHVDRTAAVEHAVAQEPAKGVIDQASIGPVGTTSVWPAKHRLGRPSPKRA